MACDDMLAEFRSTAVIGWWSGRQKVVTGFSAGRKLRRRRAGATMRLGNRRRRLTLRPIVRWSQVRWRLVVELLGPIRKTLMEIALARQLVHSQHLSLPFICNFPIPFV